MPEVITKNLGFKYFADFQDKVCVCVCVCVRVRFILYITVMLFVYLKEQLLLPKIK